MNRSLILQDIYSGPWAILPETLTDMLAVVHRYVDGGEAPALEAAGPRPAPQVGDVAVLPVSGVMIPRGGALAALYGAVSSEFLAQQFKALIADSSVGAIVLDISSPGGYAAGVEELANEVLAARGKKPVVAVANHLAASGAYWLATAADEIVVTPSGRVGSVGVYVVHEDLSAYAERLGVKVTYVSAGKYKTVGNEFEPLSDEARAIIQASVDETYDAFVKAVARGRGVNVADVRDGFGEGRVVGAKEALSLGMADRIGTLAETQARLARGSKASARGARADLEMRQRRLRLAEHS